MNRQITYDRNSVKTGILHIGVGNFHRAHEEFFIDSLISADGSQNDWGICGVILLDSDKKLYEALKSQDGVYTLTVCGRDGHDTAGYIGSLRQLLWAPADTDLSLYKRTLVERFGNASVSDQVARLCGDGLSKIPVYVMPNLKRMVADGKDLTRTAYLLAAYRHYLRYRTDDNGERFEIFEPWLSVSDRRLIDSDNPLDFLDLPAFGGVGLRDSREFTGLYLDMVRSIVDNGAMETLRNKALRK